AASLAAGAASTIRDRDDVPDLARPAVPAAVAFAVDDHPRADARAHGDIRKAPRTARERVVHEAHGGEPDVVLEAARDAERLLEGRREWQVVPAEVRREVDDPGPGIDPARCADPDRGEVALAGVGGRERPPNGLDDPRDAG